MTAIDFVETIKDVCNKNTNCYDCPFWKDYCILEKPFTWSKDDILDITTVLEEHYGTLRTSKGSSEENT